MIKDFIKNNLNGILGTTIFHLILIICFMLVRIKQYKDDYEEFIVLNFQEPEVIKEEKKKIDLSKIFPEMKAESRRNIAVNRAEDFEKKISTEEYLKQLKDELDISDPDEGWQAKKEEEFKLKNEDEGEKDNLSNPDIKPDETNIEYALKNRFARYIHNPVYKCVGSAKVVLDISVDVKGNVVNASVDKSSSNTTDPCFYEEAILAAKRWKFNADYSASARQKGSMTFKFVAQ